MNITLKRSLSAIVAGSAILGSLSFAGTALASDGMHRGERNGVKITTPRSAVVGTVTSVSGTTLTVNVKASQHENKTAASSTVYTVDATNAVVTKAGASSTVGAITVGDRVVILGTVTGTNVVATKIIDGKMFGRPEMSDRNSKMGNASTGVQFLPGNGNPVIGGNVTAMSSTTLTVTTKSGTVYTVNTASTTVQKAGIGSTVATLSSIALGDNVLVQGTVNGTSVTASSIIDQGTVGSVPSVFGENGGTAKPVGHQGFMGAIGGFFSHLFGFF